MSGDHYTDIVIRALDADPMRALELACGLADECEKDGHTALANELRDAVHEYLLAAAGVER